jgi:TolB-like protein/DNA-binding winged helix-turn-helix (wHTH) protein
MAIPRQEAFLIGEWRVCPPEGTLARGGEIVRLEPKVMEVLVYLVSRAGDVVTRDDIEREVWRGAIVGYDAVTNTIIKLRKAFGDEPREPRYIGTIPKRGYRLLAPVKRDVQARPEATRPSEAPSATAQVSASASATASPSAPAPAPVKVRRWTFAVTGAALVVLAAAAALWFPAGRAPEPMIPRAADLPSLAVLPFANLSEDTGHRYLSDGVTEDLITGLSRISGLRVIAPNSAFAFAGDDVDPRRAATRLGVRYVLQGSLRRSGEKLRVTAKLIDTDSGVLLWADQFDGGTADLFALQDRVAAGTVTALRVTLTADERKRLAARPTTSVAAYDLYLRGRVGYGNLTERERALARATYRRALEQEPGFALAYAGLALTYLDDFRQGSGPDSEVAATEALRMAEHAVVLDETLPRAHFALGFVYLYGRAQHEWAIAEAKRALALDPNYADAYVLLSSAYFFIGDLDKTEALDREALRLSPTASFVLDIHRGRRLYLKERYREALEAFLAGAAKDPNFVPSHVWLAATYAKHGQQGEAEWAADQIRTLVPGFAIDTWLQRWPYKIAEHREKLVGGLKAAGL